MDERRALKDSLKTRAPAPSKVRWHIFFSTESRSPKIAFDGCTLSRTIRPKSEAAPGVPCLPIKGSWDFPDIQDSKKGNHYSTNRIKQSKIPRGGIPNKSLPQTVAGLAPIHHSRCRRKHICVQVGPCTQDIAPFCPPNFQFSWSR